MHDNETFQTVLYFKITLLLPCAQGRRVFGNRTINGKIMTSAKYWDISFVYFSRISIRVQMLHGLDGYSQ